MATETAPSPSSSEPRESGSRGESWRPVAEKFAKTGDVAPTHRDIHNETLAARSTSLENMMREPLPEATLDAVNAVAERRAVAAEHTEPDGTFLDAYVRDERRGNEFGGLVDSLQKGKTLREATRDMKRETDDNLASDTANVSKLQAMRALSGLMRESALGEANSWDDLGGDEGAKRRVRLSEMIEAEVVTQELRYSEIVKYREEHDPGYIDRQVGYLEALQQTDDIPSNVKKRLTQTIHNARLNYVGVARDRKAAPFAEPSVSAAEPSVEDEGATEESEDAELGAGEVEAQTREAAADAVVEPTVEQAPVELRSREAVFGREGISREDLKGVSRHVSELLVEDTDESVLKAARQLVDLKLARVNISGSRKQAVFKRLLSRRERIGRADVAVQARYLSYLKYLGAVDGASEEEKQRIDLAIVSKTAHDDLGDLDQLCVNAKHLGVRDDFTKVQPYLQKNLKQLLEKPGGARQVAFARARRKYLGVAHGLSGDHVRAEDAVDSRLAGYEEEGQWDEYARLRVSVDYVRGGAPVAEAAQQGMIDRVAMGRRKAQDSNDWSSYTSYVARAALLSRLSKGVVEAPAVRRAADSDVVQFLAGLGRAHRAQEARRQPRRAEKSSRSAEAAVNPFSSAEEPQESSQTVDPKRSPRRATFAERMAEHDRMVSARDNAEGTGRGTAWSRFRRWLRGGPTKRSSTRKPSRRTDGGAKRRAA